MEAHTFMKRKVMVTGCFDLLHSGHVAFLEEAASYGDLHVCIGSDTNVAQLKGRYPINSEEERAYLLSALAFVHEVRINSGMGIMDFLSEMDEIHPDVFFVNEDGHTPQKESLCRDRDIEYLVAKRLPHGQLPARSTTALRTTCLIPYRVDIAGGWLDQPWVSKHHHGPVLTVSIEPTHDFNHRSGMATSTRKKAIELWKTALPRADQEQTAKILFSYENPPGVKTIAGSQDAIGIVFAGLNRSNYSGQYWPESIESHHEESVLQWIEQHLYLVTLAPRIQEYDVLANTHLNKKNAKTLALAAENCWDSILKMDLPTFGRHFTESFEAQIAMFPNMADAGVHNMIEQYRHLALGWKLSGAGGGGYLILVAEKPIPGAIQVKIRRIGEV